MQAYQQGKENIRSAQQPDGIPATSRHLFPKALLCFFGLCLEWHPTNCTVRVGALRLQKVSQHFQLLPGQGRRCSPRLNKADTPHTDTEPPSSAQGQNQLPRESEAPAVCSCRFGKGLGIPHRAPGPALPSSFTPRPARRATPKNYPCKAAALSPEMCVAHFSPDSVG